MSSKSKLRDHAADLVATSDQLIEAFKRIEALEAQVAVLNAAVRALRTRPDPNRPIGPRPGVPLFPEQDRPPLPWERRPGIVPIPVKRQSRPAPGQPTIVCSDPAGDGNPVLLHPVRQDGTDGSWAGD